MPSCVHDKFKCKMLPRTLSNTIYIMWETIWLSQHYFVLVFWWLGDCTFEALKKYKWMFCNINTTDKTDIKIIVILLHWLHEVCTNLLFISTYMLHTLETLIITNSMEHGFSWNVTQVVKKFLALYVTGIILLCSQESATGPCPDQSIYPSLRPFV